MKKQLWKEIIISMALLAFCGLSGTLSAGSLPGESGTGEIPTLSPGDKNEEGIISSAGTIRFVDLEGGFYGIVAPDGSQYEPLELAPEFQADGFQVRFTAKIAKEPVSIRMWGTPVEIIFMEPLIKLPESEGGEESGLRSGQEQTTQAPPVKIEPAEKEVWLAPPTFNGLKEFGEPDLHTHQEFFRMMDNPESWNFVRENTDVFLMRLEYFIPAIEGREPEELLFPDTEEGNRRLQQFFQNLTEWNMKLAVETSFLFWFEPCTAEGAWTTKNPEVGWDFSEAIYTRIRDNGGRVAYLLLDSPFNLMTTQEYEPCYKNSAREAAEEIYQYYSHVSDIFPEVKLGTTDFYRGEEANRQYGWPSLATVTQWFKTYETTTGHRFDFYNMDCAAVFHQPDPVFTPIENFVDLGAIARDELGIQFSLSLQTYPRSIWEHFGDVNYVEESYFKTNKEWYEETLETAREMVASGLVQDRYVFQQWMGRPDKFIPEDACYTYTNLVRDGLRVFRGEEPESCVPLVEPIDGDIRVLEGEQEQIERKRIL